MDLITFLYAKKLWRMHHQSRNVHYLKNDFLNSYIDLLVYKSIRPGRKCGDVTVTAIKALKYIQDDVYLKKLVHIVFGVSLNVQTL